MINDERAAEGVDHLQSAALELIQAARAFLDVAEDLVHDRERVADVVATAASLADVVAPEWATARTSGRRRPARATETTDRVQHIDVS